MESLAGAVVVFLVSAVVVASAGISLARSGEAISARTRLGGLWVGSVFLGAATSAPELLTDIAAVRMGEPDLAAGDLFGSNMANMLILSVVALLPGAEPFRETAVEHGYSASLAIVMACIAGVAVMVEPDISLFGIGPGSAFLLLVYLLGARALYHQSTALQARRVAEELAEAVTPGPDERGLPSLRRAVFAFGVAVLVIAVAAPILAASAGRIAALTGIGTTFVGTALLGLTTSLPELSTSIAAARIGQIGLAVGNLFGSNALNMAFFLPLDLANGSAPILAVVGLAHVLTVLNGILLMATALAAITYSVEWRTRTIEPIALLMIFLYAAGIAAIYAHNR